MKTKVLIGIGVLVIILLIFGGRSADKTAKQAVEAIHNNDASKFVSLMTDEAIETQLDALGIETKKLLKKNYENVFDKFQEEAKAKYGKKWKYKVKIIDSYDYIPSSDEENTYGGSKMKEVAYEIKYTGNGFLNEKDDVESGKILVVKKGMKWYMAKFG